MKSHTVPLKKGHPMMINIRLEVPESIVRARFNKATGVVEIDMSAQGVEVDVEPIHAMSDKLRLDGVAPEICAKVHDAAIDMLQQELALEVLKDYMPGYRE
jgi:hypothetical protein